MVEKGKEEVVACLVEELKSGWEVLGVGNRGSEGRVFLRFSCGFGPRTEDDDDDADDDDDDDEEGIEEGKGKREANARGKAKREMGRKEWNAEREQGFREMRRVY